MLADISGYEQCNGCGVCTLPCPVWQQNHETLLTFAGRARALQGGAQPREIRSSLEACLLCGCCEPACTMGIRTVDITLKLRAALNGGGKEELQRGHFSGSARVRKRLIPGAALRGHQNLLRRVEALLGVPVAEEDGTDILEAFQTGRPPVPQRVAQFLQTLAGLRRVVAADGLFKRYIRTVLPGLEVTGLGESLLRLPRVQAALRPTDLYIVEARAYNADFGRCMPFYTKVCRETGCAMNLDLQRIAIPAGSCHNTTVGSESASQCREQIRWMLDGRRFERIVVEAVEDFTLLSLHGRLPVIHVADLPEKDTL